MTPTPPARRSADLRLDIEGLRAVAIGTVLAFHAGLPWFSGGFIGVDIFFVLSGFLITGILAREVSRTGRIRLANFWARRARRLLPASALTLMFCVLVTYLWLPVTQRSVFGWDITSAALYVVNWRLADRSVDYLAEDVGASPVQHFWSLAVEEQFYLVWPLVILAAALLLRRRPVLSATIALAAITISSFAYSVQQSIESPETGFFVSTTRIWELGVGALLALAAPRLRQLNTTVLALLGWLGVVAIVVATFAYDGSTTWPGVPAVLPVLGAAAAIAAGLRPGPLAPGRVLAWKPMVWLGGLSYSLYLWHWPVLIAGQALIDDYRIRHGVLLTLLSLIPAWLCHHLVENPIRFGARWRPPARALKLGAVLTASGIFLGLLMPISAALEAQKEATDQQAQGARAEASNGTAWSDVNSVDSMRPLPGKAPDDVPAVYDDSRNCLSSVVSTSTKPVVCRWGEPDAEHTVVVVGDSKIVQWMDALSRIVEDRDVQIVLLSKSACAFTDAMTELEDEPWTVCREWGRAAFDLVLDLDPDLVLTSQGRRVALPGPGETEASSDAMEAGLVRLWTRLGDAGLNVAVLLDNPSPVDGSVYECVAAHPQELARCAFDKARGIERSAANPQREAARRVPSVSVIDMTDVVCPDASKCAAVIGNVLVYRQGSHLTNTFAVSAAGQLRAQLRRAAPHVFD